MLLTLMITRGIPVTHETKDEIWIPMISAVTMQSTSNSAILKIALAISVDKSGVVEGVKHPARG